MSTVARPTGLERVRTLWAMWREERTNPAPFYTLLAAEAAEALDHRYGPLRGRTVIDLGCGPGFYTRALRDRGADVIPIDNSEAELRLAGEPVEGAVIADAGALPLDDESVDGAFCSNLLEHTPDTPAVIREIERVLRPGGWAYISWTNWYSPWGGHDMSPYHFLGPTLGPRLYVRRHGQPRKNPYGDGLWAVHVGPTLREVRGRPGLEVLRVEPRYWPKLAFIARVPGLREIAMWNCVIHVRKRPDAPPRPPAEVPGWLSDGQAALLHESARRVPIGGRIVEIGSYRGRSAIVLARAAAPSVEVVAIDPHAGNDRGPRQWEGTPDEGESDHRAFLGNLERHGVAGRVRHVRRFSSQAHDAVADPIDVLYVDGAHRYTPALADVRDWGARVRPGGTLLVHDAFSSVGVTFALLRAMAVSRGWAYRGRVGSLARYERTGASPAANLAGHLGELPWFARNLLVKAALVARLAPVARALGHRDGPWPY